MENVRYEILPEIAKLGHVALETTDLEKSLWFFEEVVGLEKTETVDGVHYLRAWGDFDHHTLSIKEGPEARVDHIAWKAKRREDIGNFANLLREADVEVEEVKAGTEAGQGDAIRFQLPSGHNFEIYFDMEKPAAADPKHKSILKNQPYKAWRKGISPRRIDHVNIGTNTDASVITDFLQEKLGFKMREYLKTPDGNLGAGWLSVTNLVHDIAVMGRPDIKSSHEIHHLSYWSDNAQDILRAADILADQGIPFVGPGKHGISQAMYIYVVDPGSGVRLELFSNGYLIFEPDWEPIEWKADEMAAGFTFWGEQSGMKPEDLTTISAGEPLKSPKKV
ncbi:VOC family protein [Salinicoccus roseus]|uniref:2,3-dihydroxybiphenyl 1,2-dioxygenase n=1 Tax=Salinicoccus roseus TaxID=45670 RepID=A0A0C2HF57_9STAP|nr:VOC family protein [Salinicoccus roseus]KIH70269.1 2,3-dihydroxybiphenyl 1,2-dioxygenase [Salinicoccus roseus]MDB0581135.1 VOC family protein [Salinicoccus roseus]